MVDEAHTPEHARAAASSPRARAELIEDDYEEATVRRAPKVSVFLIVGAALGVIVALILTYAFGVVDATGSEVSRETTVAYSKSEIFGFLVLICGVIGVAVGGIVAVILDRTIGRRTKRVRVDRETVTPVD